MITIRIEDDGFTGLFANLANNLVIYFMQELQKDMDACLQDIRPIIPEDTGALRKGFQLKNKGSRIVGGFDKEYWRYQSRMRKRMKRAWLECVESKYQGALERAIERLAS